MIEKIIPQGSIDAIEKIISEDSFKEVIASISYMPSIFGLMIAGEIIKEI